MTSNQIAYWNLRESERANKAKEEETNRSNVVKEAETQRSNLVKEAETARSNKANETLKAVDIARQALLGREGLPGLFKTGGIFGK